MEITYEANPTFSRLHQDSNRYIFVRGPVGSGKSSGCIMHLFLNAMMQKPGPDGIRRSRYAVIRATYPMLKATVIKSWINWFKDKIKIAYDTPIRGMIKFDLPDDTKLEMELFFIAVGDDQSIEKLRSLELTGAHCNEASELQPELFEMLKTRIDRYPSAQDGGGVNPFILFDYNSVSTDHWLYELAEQPNRPAQHSFYAQPPAVIKLDVRFNRNDPSIAVDAAGNGYVVNMEADNVYPIEEHKGVTPGYYLQQIHGADPDFINVNLMNNYGEVRSGRPVYKEYDDTMHFAGEEIKPLKGVPIIVGIDQGLTPAAIFVQQAPDGALLVLDEITTEDCSLHEFCHDLLWPLIRRKYKKWEDQIILIVDPATVQRSMNDAKAGTDIIREAGFRYRTARTNVFTERKEAVVSFLRGNKKVLVSSSCPMLRKGFLSGYKYSEIRSSQSTMFKDSPAKNEYSHIHDAFQYAAMEFYRKPTRRTLGATRTTYRAASSIGGY